MSKTRKGALSQAQLQAVARMFDVLSQPSRLHLLQALHSGPLTVGELVEATGMKQANVSKHLGVLHAHHLIGRERAGTRVRYEIADPLIFSLCQLVCGKVERDARAAVERFHPEI
jgi:DNA-binding transcriptional ArsR family regulator